MVNVYCSFYSLKCVFSVRHTIKDNKLYSRIMYLKFHIVNLSSVVLLILNFITQNYQYIININQHTSKFIFPYILVYNCNFY